MTRSTFLSPARLAPALLAAVAIAAATMASSASLARPLEPEQLNTNTPIETGASGGDAGSQPAPGEAAPSLPAAPDGRLLPPRSSSPAASGGSGRRTMLHLPDGSWQTIGALALVVGLIVMLRKVLQRFGGPLTAKTRAPSGVLEMLGRYPVARGQTLLLIKVDRRILLVGQTSQGLSTLSEIDDPEQVASLVQRIRSDRGDSFASQFERLVTPVRHSDAGPEQRATVIDLTRGGKVSAARRVASMLADGGPR